LTELDKHYSDIFLAFDVYVVKMVRRPLQLLSLLALSADATSALSISKAPLRRVQNGALTSDAPIAGRDLWKQNGAVVFVVRRPG